MLAIPGDQASFSNLKFTVSGSVFRYGAVLDALIFFVLTAAVLFFFVVRPVNHLMARRKTEPEVEATTRDCPECLSSIPVGRQALRVLHGPPHKGHRITRQQLVG